MISLKLTPLVKPVPNALEKASFAANLFAKQFEEFFIFKHLVISLVLNIFFNNVFFLINLFILLTSTISVPTPKILIRK